MPTIVADLQKRFKLSIIDGLPEAPLEITAKAHWVKCCPLCGCTHQVIGVDEGLPYTPMCQTLPALYKTQQTTWQKLYPDVTPYTTLHLVREVSS